MQFLESRFSTGDDEFYPPSPNYTDDNNQLKVT